MDTNQRPMGIEGLGDMSLGTHFCLFYETEQDLLETLAHYFKTGLANNEFCLWLTPDSSSEKARNALQQVIPSADRHVQTGNIEILSCQQWYCADNVFDATRVIQSFEKKLTQALEKGYARMRVLADEVWLSQEHWKVFSDYEGKLNEQFADKPISIVCAYPIGTHNAADILDVARTHRFIAAKRNGTWELLESPALKHAKIEAERFAALQAEIIERKRSEEALRLSESRLQAAIHAADIVLWERDLPSGHITWLGHHEKLLGFAPGELNDNTLASYEKRVHPEDIEELRRVRQRALEERSEYRHEYRVVWRDGSIHWLAAQGRFIYNEAGQPVRLYGAVLDITERKQAEEALRKSERVLREAESLGHTGSWEQDLVTGEIFNTEENLLLFFGDDPSKGANFEDYTQVVHPDDREYVFRRRAELLEEEGPGDIEYRVIWPDGSVHVIFGRATVVRDELNQPIRVYGTNVDITERKQAEAEIQKHKEILQTIIDNVPAMITMVDKDGRFILTNRDFESRLGWRLDELSEQSLDMLAELYPDPRDRQAVLDFAEQANGQWEDFRTRAKDGQVIDTSWATVRLSDGSIIGVGKDITERKRAEEALRESEAKLKEAQQIAHIGHWERDLITDRIICSEETRRIFGRQSLSGAISQAELQEMIHPDDRPIQQQALSQALQGTQRYDVEYRIIRPNGGLRFVHVRDQILYGESGRPIRMFGTVQDITERKQAEEAIRRHVAQMEALAEISRTFEEVALDYESVLNTVAQRTAELIGDSCVITRFSDDGQRSFPVAFHHPDPKALELMHEALLHTWQGGTDTQRYQALLAGNSIYIPVVNPEEFRISLEPEFLSYQDVIGISSFIIVPLEVQGRVIGTLGITRDRHGSPYTHDDQLLLQNLANRAALTMQNAQLFEQAEDARKRLEALSHRLLEVQEAERRALTTELHDRVGQNLTGLSINLQNMKSSLSHEAAQALAERFDEAQALVQDTSRQIRDIMAELHLPELEDYGLAAALEIYAERAASRGNLELIADLLDLAPPPLPSDVCVALFRAAQEAIHNVLKHADATQMKVSLMEQAGRIRLSVEDNGQGFEPDVISQKESQTWGLKIMRERIESIGGKVQIESEPGEGTQVTFEIERPS